MLDIFLEVFYAILLNGGFYDQIIFRKITISKIWLGHSAFYFESQLLEKHCRLKNSDFPEKLDRNFEFAVVHLMEPAIISKSRSKQNLESMVGQKSFY